MHNLCEDIAFFQFLTLENVGFDTESSQIVPNLALNNSFLSFDTFLFLNFWYALIFLLFFQNSDCFLTAIYTINFSEKNTAPKIQFKIWIF